MICEYMIQELVMGIEADMQIHTQVSCFNSEEILREEFYVSLPGVLQIRLTKDRLAIEKQKFINVYTIHTHGSTQLQVTQRSG